VEQSSAVASANLLTSLLKRPNPLDNLNDILIFTKVAEQGSFTAAAERLEIPKSSVSRAVARLEKRLRAQLLHRSTRRLSLTEIGQRYYEYCRRIIDELEQANSIVEHYQTEPSGLLRISAPYILGQAFLGPIVAEFLSAYPAVQCRLELSNRRVDLIEEGIDLCIRVGRLRDSSLSMTHLGRAQTNLFASPGYLAQRDKPQRPTDLAQHVLLHLGDSLPKAWMLKQQQTEVEITIAPRLICNDAQVLMANAIAHQGIAVLPSFTAQAAVEAGLLLPLLPDWQVNRVEINALYPTYKDLSPSVRAFLEIAKAALKQSLGAAV